MGLWKKLRVINAGSDAELRFHSISDTTARIGNSSRNCREKNVPKTNDAVLFNRLRCVAYLLFRKNMGNLESGGRQSTSLRRVVPAASVANHESAGGGSIDEVWQSCL